ncbi:hypothetical protein [Thaumasiovibrio sp. DFM-14]|uniref:hypothetical protein n=1 Tax=Thaumasiovibrio sp. DFM-14 TaxID=3384792 RepID=UPI00399EECB2
MANKQQLIDELKSSCGINIGVDHGVNLNVLTLEQRLALYHDLVGDLAATRADLIVGASNASGPEQEKLVRAAMYVEATLKTNVLEGTHLEAWSQ